MIKNAAERNCKVTIEQDRLLLEADGDYKLELHLCEPINVDKSFYKFGSVKVEVTLKKVIGRTWAALTKVKAETKPAVVNIYRKNWNAFDKAIEELIGKEESEADPNAVFQKLYANADADTRRAMIKSFTESNGEALNMSWDEVSGQKKRY